MVKTPYTIDRENPPVGTRLELTGVANELNLSFTDIAAALPISRSALFSIANDNLWPVKTDATLIRKALRDFFAERGASDEQLAVLFHARLGGRDRRGSARGQPAPARTRSSTRSDQPTEDEEVTDMLMCKQTLTPPAAKHFKVFTNPFDGDVTTDDQMFTSSEIAYVREACLQAAVSGRFVAVVGESGAGKTTVLADLEARIEAEQKRVVVIRPSVLGMEGNDNQGKALKASEILMAIVQTLNPDAAVKQTMQGRTTQITKLLAESCELGNRHLLLIEEAHSMPRETLKHLKRLKELKLGRTPMLGILLVAQPELKALLKHNATYLREVIQRLEVVDLLPLDNDLQPYLACRAKAAGKQLDDFIDAAGIDEMRARLTATRRDGGGKSRTVSLCYPLAVNNLLTAAMNTAADLMVPKVTRDVVKATELSARGFA